MSSMKRELPRHQRDLARAQRSDMTAAEKRLWHKIRNRQFGAKFRRKAPIGPYIADFLSHDAKLVIELDPRHPSDKTQPDQRRSDFITGMGFRVLRFGNTDIFENLEGTLVTISSAISETPNISARATSITHSHEPPLDTITLTYDDRYRRRIALIGDNGTKFTLDLAKATQLNAGDRLLLDTGDTIEVRAAHEDVIEAIPLDPSELARVAWHVGNRHLSCQVLPDRLVLKWDHVIVDMLGKLNCEVIRKNAPFTPEGGAYGQGRTHSHGH